MEVIYGLENLPGLRVPVVVALGTFDGVHRGHQALIHLAMDRARALGGRTVVLTFDPHPLQVIAPPTEPFLLTTMEERLRLLADLGADLTIVVRFDDAFRQITAERWVTMLLQRTALAEAVCGPNYTFGHKRGGHAEALVRYGRERGFAVHIVPAVEVDGTTVSSSAIRSLLRSGDVGRATRLLGRRYGISGQVVRGDGRGAELGFPTANLLPPDDKLTPGVGIYAAFVRTPSAVQQAAVSIGTRPTFGPGRLLIEAHLLDVQEDLYGIHVEVLFVERLRDEMQFEKVEALIRQMRADVEQARQLLRHEALSTRREV